LIPSTIFAKRVMNSVILIGFIQHPTGNSFIHHHSVFCYQNLSENCKS